MKKIFTLIAALVLFTSAAMAATIDVVATEGSAKFYAEDNDLYIVLQNAEYGFAFDVVLPQGAQDIVDGQTYTFDEDMLADYSYGVDFTAQSYINYVSASITRVDGSYTATVVDEDGNTYNITYTVVPPITEPTDTIAVDMRGNFGNRAFDLVADMGAIQLIGWSNDGYLMNVVFYATQFAGSYTLADRYEDDQYFMLYSNYDAMTGDGTPIKCNNILEATVTGTADNCTARIKWVAADGTMYDIQFDYVTPTPQSQQTFTATDLVISQNANYEIYEMYYGAYAYDFEATNGQYILYGTVFNYENDDAYGEWDYEAGDIQFNLYDATTQMADAEPYNGVITIAKNGATISLTGTSLFYGNVEWTFNVTGDASPVENVENAKYQIYNAGHSIVLCGAEGQMAAIYDAAGRMISNSMIESDNARIELPAGVYMIRVNGETLRAIVK